MELLALQQTTQVKKCGSSKIISLFLATNTLRSNHTIKRAIIALFIFISASSYAQSNQDSKAQDAVQEAERLQLYTDPIWNALFQNHLGSKKIQDPQFYLSKKRELREEMIALLQGISSPQRQELACRFPARVLWLQEKLSLPFFDFTICQDLNHFIINAPAQEVSVVFAAENISQPSSMMGHVFLKLEGLNGKNIPVAHMISFFTEIQDYNIPKLIVESLITGKQSFYTLSPYEENKNYYLYTEQRNIWEYQLELTTFQRTLLHYYLYEIKSTEFNYFFNSFNCATLTRNILAVVFPDIAKENFWVSPLDVVRSIDHDSYTRKRKMIPSSKWKIKALKDEIGGSPKLLNTIKERDYSKIDTFHFDIERTWLSYDLASSFNDYSLEQGNITVDEWRVQRNSLMNKKELLIPGGSLDITNTSNISNTPGDSQVFLAGQSYLGSSKFILGYLPGAHALLDDDTQYLNQWELKMGEISVAYNDITKELNLESFVIYSAISLAPTDKLIPTLSAKLRFGYEPKIDEDYKIINTAFIDTGLGKTYRAHKSIDVFALINLSFHQLANNSWLTGPQIGVRVLHSKYLKTLADASYEFREAGSRQSTFNVSGVLDKKPYAINLDYSLITISNSRVTENQSEHMIRLTMKRLF